MNTATITYPNNSGKRIYQAFYMGKFLELEASSLYEAKQLAEKHFAPSKKTKGLLAVVLADTPISLSTL